MTDNDSALRRRFEELGDRAETRRCCIFSDFLNLHEQSVLQNMRLPHRFVLFGGFPSAERKCVCFGTTDEIQAQENAPFVLLKIAPAQQKFADTLTHRDFLGSILALGLRREMLGDILLSENCGYVFCMESIAGFITDNLERVRHTSVRITRTAELPQTLTQEPEPQSVVVASERLDALLASVFCLSRSEAQKLIAAERVFADNCVCTRSDTVLKENCTVSARGFGRFRYLGIDRETKKGKLRVAVQIFK